MFCNAVHLENISLAHSCISRSSGQGQAQGHKSITRHTHSTVKALTLLSVISVYFLPAIHSAHITQLNQMLPDVRKCVRIANSCPKFGASLPENWRCKKCPFFDGLLTAFQLNCEYLRNKHGSPTFSQNSINFAPHMAKVGHALLPILHKLAMCIMQAYGSLPLGL